MQKNTLVILAIAWCALAVMQPFNAWCAPITTPQPHPAYVTRCAPGVIYIQFKIGSTVPTSVTAKGEVIQSIGASAFQSALRKLGLREIIPFDAHASKDSIDRALGIDRIYCLYYTNRSIDPHTALSILLATGEVERGSVRYLFPLSKQTNDPYISQQYALTKMNVFNAWNTTTGDTSILIADVDCAINIDHEDLKNEIKYNWSEVGTDGQGHDKRSNGIDDDSDGYLDNWEGWDVCGDVNVSGGDILQPNNDPRPREGGASHGTHTAGCMVASGNNGVGIAGVAFGCKLLPIKAAGADFDNIGAGYEGIYYASMHGAKIINCSWGGLLANTDTALANLFLVQAHVRGALVVAAAGNGISGVTNSGVSNDVNPEYPGNGPYVLTVGSTDETDAASWFSDFGHSVSVWAPGSTILSCDYPGNNAYSAEDGTSFASPNAAGVAALLWSQHKDWLPEFISRQLIATCDNVVNPSDRSEFWGRLNASNSVSAPSGPGLIILSYSVDGVTSDSLKPGLRHDFIVTFKNVTGAGTNLSATPISSIGAQLSSTAVSLGAMSESATATGDFQITRTGVYSEGNLPVSFAVTDGSSYSDTISILLPLSRTPGFVLDRAGIQGSSIKRVSNSVAWAAFGNLTSSGVAMGAQFARERGSQWGDTTTLLDGSVAPFDVEALDSLTAYFGTGQGNAGSVIYTTDGGQNFSTVDVATFTPFVNSIHFFDAQNGILIGDPHSSRWGIGVTTNGGQSWSPLSKPVLATGSIASWNNATAWVGGNGWFGTNSRQIWRTTNYGQIWQSVKTGSNQNSLAIGFDDDARHGFACFRPAGVSGSTSVTGSNSMMVTSDSGASWQQLTTLPVPGIAPGSIRFIPNTHTAILTSNLGVYRTMDFGQTWSPIGIPISYLPDGSELSISRGAGEFVVSLNSPNNGIATYSEAIPDSVEEGVAETQRPQVFFDVTPNPTEGTTVISFALPSSDRAHIMIYDAMGRMVWDVANSLFEQGDNHITFDARALAPGAYYASFQTTSGVYLTRAITILR